MTDLRYLPPTARGSMSEARVARIFVANGGKCWICGNKILDGEKYEIEHPDPLWAGGRDDDAALRIAHVKCHAPKSAAEAGQRARRNETIARGWAGTKAKRPMDGSRNSRWKKKVNGQVERREP